ncbi:MAG: GtrA family protein [Candidatus Saccharimonadales bacterium]
MAIKNKGQKGRFIAIGGINTLIDFSVLFLLKSFGLPEVQANIVSTTAALCFSFFANRKFTFKASDTNVTREIILFIIVSLIGAWGIQSVVISISLPLLAGLHLSDYVSLFIAKVAAISVGLIWNYFMYSHVVFRKKKTS